MMNVQWLYGSVTASLVVLLSITLLVLRKRLHPQVLCTQMTPFNTGPCEILMFIIVQLLTNVS